MSAATPTLREKIGQMLLVGFRGYTVKDTDPVVRDITERNLGSVILFDQEMADRSLTGRNIQSPAQVKALTASLQSYAKNPLLIAIDQEGGRVNRLKAQYGFPDTLSHEDLGQRKSEITTTTSEGKKIAQTLKSIGINFNLAPVVDLDLAPDNPIIKGKKRSFSADPDLAAAHAGAFIVGHRVAGIRTCLKHFPGHGSARGDTHLGLVDVTETWSEKELLPFRILQRTLCDAIMTAHIFNSKLDPNYPATLSRAIIHDLLRVKMKYDGPILTDDMEMKAITSQFGLEEAVALAINAGVDLLCFGNNLSFDPEIGRKAHDIIFRHVESGKIPEARIDESFSRVQRLKQKYPLR